MVKGSQEPTLYELLGVPADADGPTIKRAYRSAARKVHPDVNPGLESMFRMVQHAYGVLSDETQRRNYDATIGQTPANPSAGPSHTAEGPRPSSAPGSGSANSSKDTHGAHRPSSAPGVRVPVEQYSGPLPREAHDPDAVPSARTDGTGQARIVRSEASWGVLIVYVAVAVILVVVGIAGSPFTLLAGSAVAIFLLLRQFGAARGAASWLLILLVLAGAVLLPAVLPTIIPGSRYSSASVASAAGVVGLALLIVGHTRMLSRRHWMRSRYARDGFSWGAPGEGLLDATARFGIDDVMDGVEGERLTAAEIGWFLSPIPGVRLVNGLRFPGSGSADVDHAVVCGDKVAFIDSKAWTPGQFTMGRDWISIREDHPGGRWRYRETNMHLAVDAYVKQMRDAGVWDVQVRGYIVVHPKTLDAPLELNSIASSGYNRMVTSPQLISELAAWFTEDREQAATVDRRTLSFLVGSMKR